MTKKAGRPNVRAIIDAMHLRAAMISPHYAGLAGSLSELADADFTLEEAAWESRKSDLCAAYGFGSSTADKPYAFSNGVAIIPVHGVLVNRFSYSWGYATGYNFLRMQIEAAAADPDVTLIVLDCNSNGGQVAGCFETADLIREAREKTPVLAVVDASCYSACYAIASAATKIIATPSAGIGSIGVVAMHMNIGGMLEKYGVEVTFIHAGKHKVDGNPYETLPADVKASLQKSIDKSYATFVNAVASGRNLSVDAVKATEAQTYDADDAVTLGLIDAVQTPSKAVASYLDELSGSTDEIKELAMGTPENKQASADQAQQADTAAIASAARTAERERMAGIMNSDEAKGKSALANHLALNTDMSVDAAKAVLTAAAPEQAPVAATPAAPAAAAPAASPFADAMGKTDNPEVGAGDAGATGDNQGEKSAASAILADQSRATGINHAK